MSASEDFKINTVNKISQCEPIVNKNDPFWGTNTFNKLNDKVPNEISIANLSITENFKLARYIFPKHDKGPTKAGLKIITPIQSLNYAVQLCLHKIPHDLKFVWDEMCGRDSEHPEISQLGLQSTKHDLRQRSEVYKRKKEKRLYVENLQQGHMSKKSRLNLAEESEQHICDTIEPDCLPTEKGIQPNVAKSQDFGLERSDLLVSTNNSGPSVSASDLAPLQISATSHIKRLPECLIEFGKFCEENNINSHEGLSRLYFTNKQTFLSILKTLIVCAKNKKSRKDLRNLRCC